MRINAVRYHEQAFCYTNPFPGWCSVYRNKLSSWAAIPGNHDFTLMPLLNGLD
jgi:hypothetical protein